LADRMGRLVQGMKSGPKSTSAVVWVIAVVAVGVFVAWYFATGAPASRSQTWVKLENDLTREDDQQRLDDLRKVAEENPGTVPARVARFQRARLLLQARGLEVLYSDQRASAIQSLEEARRLYKELAQECIDNTVLRQEALLGLARAEEALVGIPKEDNAEDSRGDLDQALKDYEQYLTIANPDSVVGKDVKKHVEELEKNRQDVVAFYTEMNRIAEAEAKNKP
jgi:tetratricopeptide (TPR) repeat protein